MTIKVYNADRLLGLMQNYVVWNKRLSDEARDVMKTIAGWIREDMALQVVEKEEYDRLLARFNHLMESPYIRSFNLVELGTGKYKRDIRLAIGPDEKLMEEGLLDCAFCGGKANIVAQKVEAENGAAFELSNTIICTCGVAMRGRHSVYKINAVGGLECVKDGRHELIKAWNRRPT